MSACMALSLLPAGVLAVEPEIEPTPRASTEIYVSESGSDTNSGLSAEAPVATLGQVSKIISETSATDFTVHVMSNIITNTSLRTWNKHVTLQSYGDGIYTITRGDSMSTVQDTARSTYNPAMIESNGSSVNSASLTLYNITLDDAGQHAGEYYIQAQNSDELTGSTQFGEDTIAHTNIVQDAIIATYNGVSTITLGSGTTLKNYGGMSAVRISGGTLVMERGSVICDDEDTTRTKGTAITDADSALYGPAGAIWMQGGTFTMNEGAEIRDMVGRAVYNETGNAIINGTISGVTSSSAMWQGTSGAVMHMRVGATATLGSTGKIDGAEKKLNGNGVDVLGGCTFTADFGSVITGYSGGNVLSIGGTAYLNGEITGLTGDGHAINAQSSSNHYIRIGETAIIHDNICNYGVIYTQGNNGVIDIYGKINDNVSTDRGGALVLANNGTHVEVNMYDGAEMCNNVSYQTGGAVMVSCGTFTMHGGTISGNISGAGTVGASDQVGGGVYVRRGGQFIMHGGEIINNYAAGVGGGIGFVSGDYNNSVPYVQLNGGTISGNYMNATVTSSTSDGYTATGGVSNDITIVGGSEYGKADRYLSVDPSVTLGDDSIYMDDHDFYLQRIDDVKLGNTSSSNESAHIAESTDLGWDGDLLAALWMQSGNAQELAFTGVDGNADLPVYALVMGTGEDGNVPAGGTAAAYAVTKNPDGTMTAAIPSTGANGSSVALVQPTEDYGTLTMTASPESIASGDFTDGKAAISYTASYLLSGNLKNQITGEQEFTLTISLDSLLDYTADSMMVNGQPAAAVDNGDGAISVTFTADNSTDEVAVSFSAALDAADFSAGGQLLTSGEISAELPVPDSTVSVRVPSNAAIVEMEPYAITASAGTGGSISPSGTVLADQGESLTFTITADSGYEISDVLVDGASVGAVSTYTFENVTSDHTIAASFRSTSSGGGTVRHTITASAGDGGSIDPDGSVRVRRGSDQAFTITPNEGYKISDVLVDGESVGAVRSYTFENVRANHTIEAVFEETGKVADPDDTGVSGWLNTDDHMAYLNGYPDGTFRPDRNMTRAEAAQLFYNLLLAKDVAATVSFDDVDSSAWYAEAVDTLASLGIINGVGDGKFEPERSITRAEFTTIAMRFAKLPAGGENIFSDVAQGDWFYRYVVGSIQYGWINGYPDGTFRPNNTITRAEVTTIVNNMLGRSADEAFVDSNSASLVQFTDLSASHWAYYGIMEATNAHHYTKDGGAEDWTGLK